MQRNVDEEGTFVQKIQIMKVHVRVDLINFESSCFAGGLQRRRLEKWTVELHALVLQLTLRWSASVLSRS